MQEALAFKFIENFVLTQTPKYYYNTNLQLINNHSELL